MPQISARVIVLAGPSGAGKSRLAERLGLPVLRLDVLLLRRGWTLMRALEPAPHG